jgi:hypothetical protein
MTDRGPEIEETLGPDSQSGSGHQTRGLAVPASPDRGSTSRAHAASLPQYQGCCYSLEEASRWPLVLPAAVGTASAGVVPH